MTISLVIDLAVLAASVVLLQAYLGRRVANPSGLPYPPGPKPLPLVGNLFDAPKHDSSKIFSAWGKQYGELVHMSMFGEHFVIINSLRVAEDLLEKRSKKYSDKPVIPLIELTGWDWNLGLLPYGDRWRVRRREIHQQFRAEKVDDYAPVVMKHAHQLLDNLLNTPANYQSHLKHYVGAVILKITYDYDVAHEDDRYVYMAERAAGIGGTLFVPGGTLANVFPILCHLPAWLPGMEFKRQAEECMKLTTEMRNMPVEYVKRQMKSGAPSACVTSELIRRFSNSNGLSTDSEDVIKDVSAVAYAGGAETTAASLKTAILIMLLHPDATREAQREIDSVIGNARLPTLDDRGSMPYVDAFFREVLRWHPVTPLSVPRKASEDDVYEGYFIPKGATVVQNTWAIHHDEQLYDEPSMFKPERFLERDGSLSDRYPMTLFGMGRRICPGRYLADSAIWAAIALILAVFDIAKAKDENGRDIEIAEAYTDAIVSHPLPFACSIKPRTRGAESLVREEAGAVQNGTA
ncbi:cytochrome P450 [Heliocybe sulcata]|uniref:Cytochrome P450 n=1 Tax=Heliocybe sulcata TaxID=5364 RepID=A0A5C3N7J9_9AGAM|nr:cytochrome P450 [Heliocybe sulcata]